jgi:pimeloyl-ACP methyl ester carboxylesterase
MKRAWCIFVAALSLTGCASGNKIPGNTPDGSIADKLDETGRKIDACYDVQINGCTERISVQSNNIENNEILLYLHGGPGSSTFLYSHLYSEKLKDHFIFVNWDQRGTALSYHEGMTSNISEDIIRDDTLTLVKYLIRTFHKKKVYLLGHSFGSVLGLQLVANHPEYFYAYIGVGQVIPYNYDRSVEITYRWLHKVLEDAKDEEGLKRIEADHFPYIDLVTKYGGHHRLSIDLDTLKKTSPYYFDGYLELAEKAKTYTLECMEKTPDLRQAFNKPLSEIPVPLYFFEGVNDHVIACAPELVVEYCRTVKAPKAEIVWFKDSAHMPNIEEPVKFQDELILIREETRE